MACYNGDRKLLVIRSVNDTSNAIALRADIHTAFDAGWFVFTPRFGVWVAHFLDPTLDLGPMYHNAEVLFGTGGSNHFFLARFAWSIFPCVNAFFTNGPKSCFGYVLRKENMNA